ncbi:MAG: hypothetical protein A3I05_02090 [Deltaproteobacteria bacterium RIFCSPLOWO2_02_FULL_44_10]|nr:MAG: hypothetical protein A3I05_02090 [Deltaproteobacteria bacterium RIFCSPLOWO2_02_FULL_44_10]
MRFHADVEKIKDVSLCEVMKQEKELRSFFRKLPVDLVFLHGSFSMQNMKPLSDIDIALLFQNDKGTFSLIGKIREKMEEVFGRTDIDIAILNRASPLLWMNVLQTGKLLYCRNEKSFKQFRLKTIQRYLNTKHLRRQLHLSLQEAVLRKAS